MRGTLTAHLRTVIATGLGEDGQTLVESGLIIVFVAVVLVEALAALSGNLSALVNTVGSALNP